MTDDRLAKAARAFVAARAAEDEAKQALEVARRRRAEAGEKVAKTRAPLAEAIVEAARQGVRQRDILTQINNAYTRERVRQICRAAGIEPIDD